MRFPGLPTAYQRRHLERGVRAALALPAWIIGVSYLGVGSLARDIGHPVGAAMLSTMLIYAAPAQLILYTAIASGGSILAAAIAVALSAIRLMPMTIAIMPYLRRPGQSLGAQLLLAHPVAATVWIDGMRNLPDFEPEARVPYFAGFALTCIVLCTVMTYLGYELVGTLPLPLAAGLLCVIPIYFMVAMAAGAAGFGDWVAIGCGLGLAPLATLAVGTDYDLLVAGLLGGTVAYGLDRARRRRSKAEP